MGHGMKHLPFVLLAFTGCSSPGDEEQTGSKIIGIWDELTSAMQSDPGVTTFRDDGTYEIDGENKFDVGTYVEEGLTLILTREDGTTAELPYASNGLLYTPIGLRRVGGGTELQGEWRAEGTNAGNQQRVVLQLAADETYNLEIDNAHFSGPWRVENGELITTFEFPPEGTDMQWHAIDDTISFITYERR